MNKTELRKFVGRRVYIKSGRYGRPREAYVLAAEPHVIRKDYGEPFKKDGRTVRELLRTYAEPGLSYHQSCYPVAVAELPYYRRGGVAVRWLLEVHSGRDIHDADASDAAKYLCEVRQQDEQAAVRRKIAALLPRVEAANAVLTDVFGPTESTFDQRRFMLSNHTGNSDSVSLNLDDFEKLIKHIARHSG